MTTPESGLQDNGRPRSQQPPETAERRVAGWQRALRWVAWLGFLGLAIWKSQSVAFSGLEFLALAVAIGVTIFCVAKPLGGPKVDLSEPAHMLGRFVSRTNWALVLIGSILTVGGVAATMAIVYDMSTGRAGFGDVVRDIAVFIEGWFTEIFLGGFYDAELEKTHAYALFVLLLPGLLLLWYNVIPFFKRGNEFQVEPDGSVAVRAGATWPALLEYEYSDVTADGTTIEFKPPQGRGTLILPQQRVFSREYGVRLPAKTSAEFFRRRLTARGFESTSPRRRAAVISPHAVSRSRPSQKNRDHSAVDRRHCRPDDASQGPPVTHERLERGGRRRESFRYQHALEESAGGMQPDAVGTTVCDFPAQKVIRRRQRCQLEPEHMPMHDQHCGSQPPGNIFQTRANQLLGGPAVGRGQGHLKRVGVVARLRRYDRSPLYASHFRPTPFSIRG